MNRDESKLREVFERKLGDLKPSTPVETIRRGAKRGRALTALATVVFVSLAAAGGYALTRTTEGEQNRVVGPGPEQSGQIVFTRWAPEGNGFYVMNGDGSDTKELIDGQGPYAHDMPAWSPDGSKVAFRGYFEPARGKQGGVFVANADGSDMRLVVRGAGHPSWSPSGDRLVIDVQGQLEIVSLDGTLSKSFTDFDGEFPDWSPDGDRIGFIRSDLYVVPSQGGVPTKILDNEASRPGGVHPNPLHPQWSPDGTQIAFTMAGSSPEENKIAIVGAGGGEVQEVTTGSSPTWSPGGTRLAFTRSAGTNMSHIYSINVDGSDERQLTFGEVADHSPDWTGSPPEEEPRSAFQDLEPGWNELVAPPEPRTEAATVWAPTSSGAKLMMWGGYVGSGGSYPAEGFAWSEQSDSWDEIAASPIEPRAGAAGVFTGTEVIFWGGYGVRESKLNDGAAYDPETDTWRELPRAPIAGAIPIASVWTGQEVILWGSSDRDQDSLEGAAYNPTNDKWRRLPDAPNAINEGSAAWTGDELIVFGADLDAGNRSKLDHAVGVAYSPATNSWRELPDVDLSPQASAVAWTGERLIAWDYELQAASYDPEADEWETIPKVPLEFSECYPTTEFVGSYVFAWFCGEAALWDVRTNAWSRINTPDRIVPGEPVVAGEVLLFAGANHESQGNSMWAYPPPP